MKKIIQLVLSVFVLMNCFVHVSADYQEENDSLYNTNQIDNELQNAIISGSGTEDDPYVVDYDLAPSAWDTVLDVLNEVNGKSYSEIVSLVFSALTQAGITSVGGYSATAIAQASAVVVGAVGSHLAVAIMIASVVNLMSLTEVSPAADNGLNLLNISYLTSYHGAWYQNTTREAGWENDMVYIPSSTYGTGLFTSN